MNAHNNPSVKPQGASQSAADLSRQIGNGSTAAMRLSRKPDRQVLKEMQPAVERAAQTANRIRRRLITPDGIPYETCDPEPTPRTREAIDNMVSAAVRHIREQQRTRWEYHRERWDTWPSTEQADQRLANLGEDGWELVTVTTVPCSSTSGWVWAIFKRPSYGTAFVGPDESHPGRVDS